MEAHDSRHWLLTWSTYGTWVPAGHRDGSTVGTIVDGRVVRPSGEASERDLQRERAAAARRLLRDAPVWFSRHDAEIVLRSFRETAAHHGWVLHAVAIMPNHLHVVVTVDGDPSPSVLLRDFKAYASRALNRDRALPPGERGRWWTRSAATKPLRDEQRIADAVKYVAAQSDCLLLHRAEAP